MPPPGPTLRGTSQGPGHVRHHLQVCGHPAVGGRPVHLQLGPLPPAGLRGYECQARLVGHLRKALRDTGSVYPTWADRPAAGATAGPGGGLRAL